VGVKILSIRRAATALSIDKTRPLAFRTIDHAYHQLHFHGWPGVLARMEPQRTNAHRI